MAIGGCRSALVSHGRNWPVPDGRFRHYYWQIRTLLSEKEHLLDTNHAAYEICEDYEAE